MKRLATLALTLISLSYLATVYADAAVAADAPKDRVIAMYFHRTQRCPTCKKMGSYSEEAVKKGFANELKKGTVEFHHIDFQNAKNAKYAKAYDISGPALIVAKIVDNRVAEYKDLDDIWTNVGDKPAFMKYVKDGIADYRK